MGNGGRGGLPLCGFGHVLLRGCLLVNVLLICFEDALLVCSLSVVDGLNSISIWFSTLGGLVPTVV